MEEEVDEIVLIQNLERRLKTYRFALLVTMVLCLFFSISIILTFVYDYFMLRYHYSTYVIIFFVCEVVIFFDIVCIGNHLRLERPYSWTVSAHIATYLTCFIVVIVILLVYQDVFKLVWFFNIFNIFLFVVLFLINFELFKYFEIIQLLDEERRKITLDLAKMSSLTFSTKPIYISLYGPAVNVGAGPSKKKTANKKAYIMTEE